MAPDSCWLSFHLFTRMPLEPLLAEALLPMVEAERAAGRLKRFFFIRYSEGGPHLRLRFLPSGGHRAAIARALAAHMRAYGAANSGAGVGWQLRVQPYARLEHYFGESLYSVYAELLNEQTSYTALRLLQAFASRRGELLVMVAWVVRAALESAADSQRAREGAVDEWQAFAATASARLGLRIQPDPRRVEAIARAVMGAARAVAGPAAADPGVRRIGHLLRRVRRMDGRGHHVAAHAVHLLCNKVGFTLADEVSLAAALQSQAIALCPPTEGLPSVPECQS